MARFHLDSDGGRYESTDDLPSDGRIEMPFEGEVPWGADFHGRVRFSRRFNRPTGIEAGERVFLVLEQGNLPALVELNARVLGEVGSAPDPSRFEVTDQLLPHNRIQITVEIPFEENPLPFPGTKPMNPWGEVRLEILPL